MKKWLTGLLSGSTGEKKKGQKEMSKSKPAPKAAKAAKPAAKAKTKAEPKPAAKAKVAAVEKPAKAAPIEKPAKTVAPKVKAAPEAEKPAVEKPVKEKKVAATEASAPAKKPKKGAAQPEVITASGLVDNSTPENKKKWRDLKERYGKDKASTYNMSAQFEAEQPLEHKVLGWGYILTNNQDRLEVLFETGVKILISNYKA